jgi:hypothetical protein
MYNSTLETVLEILGAIVRFIGLLGFGAAFGWLVLEFFRKGEQAWPLQVAIFLGFVVLIIAAAATLTPAALGGFGLGLTAAMFIWGLPRKKKEEEK